MVSFQAAMEEAATTGFARGRTVRSKERKGRRGGREGEEEEDRRVEGGQEKIRLYAVYFSY